MRRAFVLLLLLTVACSGQAAGTRMASPRTGSTPPPKLSIGGIVEYRVPDPPTQPADCYGSCVASIGSLALGPDGNIWYVDGARWLVGRISPAGEIKQFST